METIAFYTFAALTTAMFWITVTSKNALYAMSSLAAGMIFIAGFFFLLNADFLGVVQIVVYTGAVMALYAFGMMFFDSSRDVEERVISPKAVVVISIIIGVVLLAMVGAPIASTMVEPDAKLIEGVQNPQAIGAVLFTKYLIPFELASVMLLAAMVAGIVLASKKMDVSLTTMNEEDQNMDSFKEFRHPHSKGDHE